MRLIRFLSIVAHRHSFPFSAEYVSFFRPLKRHNIRASASCVLAEALLRNKGTSDEMATDKCDIVERLSRTKTEQTKSLPSSEQTVHCAGNFDSKKKKTTHKSRLNQMVPKAGLEPARVRTRLILSQVRLPIPPLRHDALNPSERFKLYYLLKDMSRHRLQNFCGIKSTDTLCVVQFSFAKHIVYLFRSK